jgi:hypothetical protein
MSPRVPLYDRLPEIYRIKDAEKLPSDQLRHFLALVESVYGDIHKNIESLYHDLFIETCDDWVIPYIGDLLGTSALKGDSWTLRADVADTIALRRRKGTLGAIARLTYDLTRWGVHCVELREALLWHQHLNHQRPDEGGKPPYRDLFQTKELQASPTLNRQELHRQSNQAVRGGTVPLRDPALLSLLNTPFDPFAHTPDLKPPALGNIRYNLPNLAIFLWRLAAYRVEVSCPVIHSITDLSATATGLQAAFIVRLDVHPGEVGRTYTEPVRLFNTGRFDPNRQPPVLSLIDETPGPIPPARLTQGSIAGVPAQYVSVETYDPASLSNPNNPVLEVLNLSEVGLQFHLPQLPFPGEDWTFRGANLCAWETGLRSPLNNREIAIDPLIGRVVMGVNSNAEATALQERLLMTYTYGEAGPVGAHPISRASSPKEWLGEAVNPITVVNYHYNSNGLQNALNNIENLTQPLVIEIQDSMTHVLDVGAIAGTLAEDGGANLLLNRSLIIRAISSQRPTIVLTQPLRFRPTNVVGATPAEQDQFDAVMDRLTVRLEGLYLTRSSSFPAGEPLIARAALNRLEVLGCTLDPGGFKQLSGNRAPIQTSLRLRKPYGFTDANAETEFKQTPEIILQRSITGPLLIDTGYNLSLTDSILDAGKGVDDDPDTSFAVTSAIDPINDWGPPTTVSGITVFGRMRVERIKGKGGIWVHTLEVLNNQTGCLKFSYFSGKGDRLPQNHACVTGAVLNFVSESFGHPAYAQLDDTTDYRILEQGPNEDAMGAFGFLLEAHKWRNLQIRYREFMPVGIRPLLIPVT